MKREQRPLADWLGQKVRVTGYIDRWVTREGKTYCLLRNIEVCSYKNSDLSKIRNFDHLWVMVGPENEKERLCSVEWIGDVVRYQRRDGSIDYAIEMTHSGSFDESFVFALRMCKTKDECFWAVEMLENALSDLRSERYNLPVHFPYDLWEKTLLGGIDRFSRMIKKAEDKNRKKSQKREWLSINSKTA